MDGKQISKSKCLACGGEKEFKKKFCDECREMREWARLKRKQFRPARPCQACGEYTVKGRSVRYCEKCRNAEVMCWKCGEKPVRAFRKRLCEDCNQDAKAHRATYSREAQRKYRADPVKLAHMKKRNKAYDLKRRKKKAVRERLAENARMGYRLNHNSKPVSEEQYLKGYGRLRRKDKLPCAPLVPFMEQWLDQNPNTVNGLMVNSILKLSKNSGVNDKLIRWVMHGKLDTIQISDADKICVAMDTTLDWVYDREISKDGNLCA